MLRKKIRISLVVSLIIACAGCGSFGEKFLVNTAENDPTIYRPGSSKASALSVRLDGFELGCTETVVNFEVDDNPLTLELSKRIVAESSGVHAEVIAEIEDHAAIKLGSRRDNAYNSLAAGLEQATTNNRCILTHRSGFEPGVTALVAADVIHRQLPTTYSSVLRHAYNHQVWPKDDKTTWISVDMVAGMRLRIENSLPIAPYGINSRGSHPSSFAAPAYLYFHALSGSELCDPRAKPATTNPNSGYICDKDKDSWENAIFLSASGGLTRLGLQQRNEDQATAKIAKFAERTKKTITIANTIFIRANQTSGLIDLLERPAQGEGAWRYWRLWLPAHRKTTPNTALTDGNLGSTEDIFNTPLLRAANSFDELGEVDGSDGPCDSASPPESWRCHSLHYRVVPIPEITIIVNGIRQWVPLGTTLADLIAFKLHVPSFGSNEPSVYGALNPETVDGGALLSRVLKDVQVLRMHQGAQFPVVAKYENAREQRRFLRLQLLAGDEIIWK